MSRFVFLVFLMAVNCTAYSQKMYVWAPKKFSPAPRIGFLQGDTIFLSIFDARMITKKNKIESTSEEVIENVHNLIAQSYPSATIVYDNNLYYKKSSKTAITIKIAISAYHAGFGSDITMGIGSRGGSFSAMVFPKGKWNAMTAYNVRITDNREGRNIEQSKDVSSVDSASNMMGYQSAKKCLTNSYVSATQQLFMFIDSVLMHE